MDTQQHKTLPEQPKRSPSISTVYNLSMGLLWTFMGAIFLGHERFGIPLAVDPGLAALFGGACVLYGLFRLWRGIQSARA